MATRYCGTLKLTITLRPNETYSVRLEEENDDGRFATLHGLRLSPFHAGKYASDCRTAYDLAARAAINFAAHADDGVYQFAEVDPGGEPVIVRSRD
jgi:hypothetical protein